MVKKIAVFLCLLWLFYCIELAYPKTKANNNLQEIKFAALPFDSTLIMAKIFFPLTKYLEEKCHIKIKFVTAPNWEHFRERYEAGEYDIVYSNPYQYIRAHKTANYLPIAKVAGEPFTGIILVRNDSKIKSPEDLVGKRIAFPHRDAWAAFWLTKDYLLEKGIDMEKDLTLEFVESHKASILACYHGLVDASATWRPLRLINKEVQESLRILIETKPHPNMPVSIHPRVKPEIVSLLKKTLLNLHQDREGKRILKSFNHVKFVEAYDSDYNITRDMCKKLGCSY